MDPNSIPPLIEKNWHSITSYTLSKIRSLLDATNTLLNDMDEEECELEYATFTIGTGDPSIAAGLYTFAVEEYGKYLYLKSLKPINGKYHVDYNEFKNHPKKFERALSNLPDECKLLNRGEDEDPRYYYLDTHEDIIVNFETRLRIFYSDLDPFFANKISKYDPPITLKLLKSGVQKLSEIVDSEYIKVIANRNKK